MKTKLNREEIALGIAFGASMVFMVGSVLAAALAATCGLLWSIGGSGAGRAFRFVGVPVAAFAVLASKGFAFWPCVISSVLAGAVLSLGYGIPTEQPKDEGSPIGRFFYDLAKMREELATLYTRGFLAALLAAAYLPVQGVNLAWAGFLGGLVGLHLIVVKSVE